MNIGMLWFDNDPKADLKTKVLRAAAYYAEKYGAAPNVCQVNPSMLETGVKIDGVNVQANKSVLPNHFWVGVIQ